MLKTFIPLNNKIPVPGEFGVSPVVELTGRALALLNSEEKEELASLSNKKRQQEYVTARLMIKRLSHKMGMESEDFLIIKDKWGQPCGKCGGNDYFVSIAHTRNAVFCGISPGFPIGVDLEPVHREVPEKLKDRMLHSGERQILKEIEAIRLWTIKEALIKLEGKGLRMNMNEIRVQPVKKGFFAEINNDKTAKICSFQSEDNWLAVAYYEP